MTAKIRVALVHNLPRGGAHRRVVEQSARLGAWCDLTEIIPSTATPATPSPRVVPMRVSANAAHPRVRPITRYVDLYEMRRAWRELSGVLEAASYDAVWLNPCRYLQAPAISDAVAVKSVYYCDEPARAYHDPSVTNATRPLTRPLYLPLHRTKRRIDIDRSQAVAAIVTNSHYSAQMIEQAYGRRASIDPLGVDDRFSPGGESTSRVHALSVGSLIPSKGHDLASYTIARA